MPTRRFSDLSPAEQLDVLDAFLGTSEKVDFTEKLAGQHLTLIVHPDGSVEHVGKFGGKSGLFPAVNKAIKNYHPSVANDVRYEFEVLKKDFRSDFINYPIEKDAIVVELTGQMPKSIVDVLNSSQDQIGFMSRDAIKKKVGGLAIDSDVVEDLTLYRDMISAGTHPPKPEAKRIELILMELINSGKLPSSLGSAAIEGLFGNVASGGFKIPSKSYADLQRDQSKFFAVMRKTPMATLKARFASAVSNPSSDRLVSDVLEYIEKMSTKETPRGFRVYFSKQELTNLKALSEEYRSGSVAAGVELAETFFKRVQNKSSWHVIEHRKYLS